MSLTDTIEPITDSIEGACARLGISRSTLYREIGAGRMRVLKAGKRTLVPRREQDRWLNALPEWQMPPTDFDRTPDDELQALVARSAEGAK